MKENIKDSEVVDYETMNMENNGLEPKRKSNNAETAKWLLKRFFTFIFSVLYFITLNAFVIIVILKMAFSNGFIEEIIKVSSSNSYTNVNDLAYVSQEEMTKSKEINNTIQNEEELENIAKKYDLDEMDIDEIEAYFEDTVLSILKENNIPEDIFEYTDDNDENIELLSEIASQFIQYAYGVTDELQINEKVVEKLINNSINNYERETGNKVDRQKVSNAASAFTDEFESFVEENSGNDIRRVINAVFNGSIYYTILILMVIFIGIIVLLNLENFRFLKTLSIPTAIVGITYLLISKVAISAVKELSDLDSLTNSMVKVGAILTILSISALIVHYILKYMKKKSSEAYA
ncbi:MAG: hypothetical protein ACI31M_02325 [Bacilli bacterium]